MVSFCMFFCIETFLNWFRLGYSKYLCTRKQKNMTQSYNVDRKLDFMSENEQKICPGKIIFIFQTQFSA